MEGTMRLARLTLLLPVVLAAGACSAGGTGAGTSAAPAAATRIEVKLTDQMKIEPDPITVPRSRLVTFVVTNTGALEHEFHVGDEAEQASHEQEMAATGSHIHDHFNGVGVAPGQTRELKMIFDAAGDILAGCHVAGHYLAGMKASINVG
jgi:uncharacterized cupredoxin-like copper-binding protein